MSSISHSNQKLGFYCEYFCIPTHTTLITVVTASWKIPLLERITGIPAGGILYNNTRQLEKEIYYFLLIVLAIASLIVTGK